MKRGMIAAAVLMISTMAASAEMLTFSLQYDTTFANEASASTRGIGIGDKSDVLFRGAGGNNPDWVHRISVYYTVDGLAAGEDFAALAMSITLSGGITPSPGITRSWAPYNPVVVLPGQFDPTVTTETSALYSRSADAGPNTNDLSAILVETDPFVEWGLENAYLNPNSTIDGVPITSAAGPEHGVDKLGYVFVKWDGSYGEISVTGCPDDPESHNWAKFTGNENGTSGHVEAIHSVNSSGQSIAITTGALLAIPEPVTLSLLACGGLVLLGRRRRQ